MKDLICTYMRPLWLILSPSVQTLGISKISKRTPQPTRSHFLLGFIYVLFSFTIFICFILFLAFFFRFFRSWFIILQHTDLSNLILNSNFQWKTLHYIVVSANEGKHLTLSGQRSLTHRNQSIDLLCKPTDWFIYDRDLYHDRVKPRELLTHFMSLVSFYTLWKHRKTCSWCVQRVQKVISGMTWVNYTGYTHSLYLFHVSVSLHFKDFKYSPVYAEITEITQIKEK